jgi:hypothetical protein
LKNRPRGPENPDICTPRKRLKLRPVFRAAIARLKRRRILRRLEAPANRIIAEFDAAFPPYRAGFAILAARNEWLLTFVSMSAAKVRRPIIRWASG